MQYYKYTFLLLLLLIIVIGVFMNPPIPQDPAYHNFADNRSFLNIPNFFNVITNLPYLIFGMIGYRHIQKNSDIPVINIIRHVYILFFIGVALVAAGSSYYHLSPDNQTLLWDRLPMTLAFISLLVVILAEYINTNAAAKLYFPLIAFGLFSVFYWHYSETLNAGDLRLYILVQFLPVIFIPVILALFKSCFTHSHYYLLIIAVYIFAKLFEFYDSQIFELGGVISGHSLKHLCSSLAPFLFYLAIKKRRPVSISG